MERISTTMEKLPTQTIMIMNLFALRIESILRHLARIVGQLRNHQRFIHPVSFTSIFTVLLETKLTMENFQLRHHIEM